jgi:hypothetical protein
MKKQPLTSSTEQFLSVDPGQERGIQLHKSYADFIYFAVAAISSASTFFYFLYGYISILILGFICVGVSLSLDLYIKHRFNFSEEDVILYYAKEFYEEPSQENLERLKSWNRKRFDFRRTYYFPLIGNLIITGQKTEDPVDFVKKNLPDSLRMLERQYTEDYQSIITIRDDTPENYVHLIQEANYCYKFGAYTSTVIVIRKIVEMAIDEILMSKGIYFHLDEETLSAKIKLFISEVIEAEYGESSAEDIKIKLHNIRDLGNQSAHSKKVVSHEEVESLVDESQGVITILLNIRRETIGDE